MRRSGNKEENKRILMDLDVVLKSHDCPYIVQCFGTFITNVSPPGPQHPGPSGGEAGVSISSHHVPYPHPHRRTSSLPWSSWARAPRS